MQGRCTVEINRKQINGLHINWKFIMLYIIKKVFKTILFILDFIKSRLTSFLILKLLYTLQFIILNNYFSSCPVEVKHVELLAFKVTGTSQFTVLF
jgi:hypothetical protein